MRGFKRRDRAGTDLISTVSNPEKKSYVGKLVGDALGSADGYEVGLALGSADGSAVGLALGSADGESDGVDEGDRVGGGVGRQLLMMQKLEFSKLHRLN